MLFLSLSDKSRVPSLIPLVWAAVWTLSVASMLPGQTARNNPFSPSPPGRSKRTTAGSPGTEPGRGEVAFIIQPSRAESIRADLQVGGQPTFKIVRNADEPQPPPAEIYKVGRGDVLYITLKNVPHGSGYYTVRPDGTIDYPLAGEPVVVAEQTVEQIGDILAERIKLFRDAQVSVTVRDYTSHRITVGGMVERPGEKSLQREAMPLFTIRAEAGVLRGATKVQIRRNTSQKSEIHLLSNAETDNTLIFPGDIVEFLRDSGGLRAGPGLFYFVSGDVVSAGQREYLDGLTLYQAVTAAGGPKGDPKRAILRRKNNAGRLVSFEHNLHAIKSGKAQDPALLAGDVVEIKN